jgi:hypothetical protein
MNKSVLLKSHIYNRIVFRIILWIGFGLEGSIEKKWLVTNNPQYFQENYSYCDSITI